MELKLNIHLDVVKYSLWVQKKIPLGGVQVGAGPPNVNLGPPNISETTRARKMTLKTPLDMSNALGTKKIPLESTRRSAIADKLRSLFCKLVEVLQDFLSENVHKKFTTDYNVA